MPTVSKSAAKRIKDKEKKDALEAQLAATQAQVEALKLDKTKRDERHERRSSHLGDGVAGPSNAPPSHSDAQGPSQAGPEHMHTPQQDVTMAQGSPTGLTTVHKAQVGGPAAKAAAAMFARAAGLPPKQDKPGSHTPTVKSVSSTQSSSVAPDRRMPMPTNAGAELPHQELPPSVPVDTFVPVNPVPVATATVEPQPADPEPSIMEALQEAASAGVNVNNLVASQIPAVMEAVKSLRSLKKIASAPASEAGSVRSHRTQDSKLSVANLTVLSVQHGKAANRSVQDFVRNVASESHFVTVVEANVTAMATPSVMRPVSAQQVQAQVRGGHKAAFSLGGIGRALQAGDCVALTGTCHPS